MKKLLFAVFTLAAGVLFLPRPAQAQVSNWELNLHGGALRYDLEFGDDDDVEGDDESDDTDVLLGARLVRNTSSGFAIGGNFDWVLADKIDLPATAEDDDINVNLYLYSIELDYVFPIASRAQLFAGAGFGGHTVQFHDLPGGDESFTDPLIPLAVGLKIVNDPVDPTWGFRVDVRDNAVIRDVADSLGGNKDSEWEDNFELSGGVSFFFGGGPSYEEPEPVGDSDNDGVTDDFDRCPNTPAGTRVDSTGCPIPVDSDNDGVPDDRDQCPNTPAGTEVDSNGCEIVEEAPAACVDGRDWYRTDAQISVEAGSWIKFGSTRTLTEGELTRIGEYDGVPVYVQTDATRPYTEIFLPLCAPANSYQAYRPAQAVRGTTG
ncbi:MAG TPA: outer membrane beta-barrel protein [Gemmatimonadota bacterium]|nr:outer membrane beta-barrel protein [Gemmatimonadota bacterium]